MSRRRGLEHHRESLMEIRDIMNAMKTLAYLETRKLARFLDAHQALVSNLETVARDFLSFYPELLPKGQETTSVYLLIGTERGFCGDFNQSIVAHFEQLMESNATNNPNLIVVGHKLHTLMEADSRVVAYIDGAGVAEEVPVVLQQIVNQLVALQNQYDTVSVNGIYHDAEAGIREDRFLPPFQDLLQLPQQYTFAPQLNITPERFLIDLTEHYLFMDLHKMLYTSLMAENHLRAVHLEDAIQHLDEEAEDLFRQCNTLRQEEIIEEIEVILLSSGILGDSDESGDS